MEYFYNTLECNNKTENPFRSPSKYQALQYPVTSSSGMSNSTTPVGKVSLLQLHKQAIFPQLNQTDEKVLKVPGSGSNSLKSTNESGQPLTPMQKKYDWYPNNSILSPMKPNIQAESPAPKSIKSFYKHSSVIVRNDPMTP
jgi:hypothetical protein